MGRALGHITQPAHTATTTTATTATTLFVAICDSSLHSQVSWGPVMWCCHESSCQSRGDKSMISIRASLARPAALQHCSTAVMRILHTVCTLRDTSLLLLPHIHRAQHNKQQASLLCSINGVLVTRKIRPCHCPHFWHCCRHQAAAELGHLFLSAIWMPIELSQNKLAAHQLVFDIRIWIEFQCL